MMIHEFILSIIGGLAFLFCIVYLGAGLRKIKDKLTGSNDFDGGKYESAADWHIKDVLYAWLSFAIVVGFFFFIAAIFS